MAEFDPESARQTRSPHALAARSDFSRLSERKLPPTTAVISLAMILYALASRQVQETVDLFSTREEAEAALRAILEVEPRLSNDAFVAEIALEDPSPN